ncbi:hypothetical protein ACTFIZ_002680 [Dictyostelium cf. discoideum]
MNQKNNNYGGDLSKKKSIELITENEFNKFTLYKFQCIAEVAKQILRDLLKERYLKETGKEWENNSFSGVYIKKISKYYKMANPIIKDRINTGIIEYYLLDQLTELLTEDSPIGSKYSKIDSNTLNQQSIVIKKIYQLQKRPINRESFEIGRKLMKEYLTLLKPTFNGDTEIDFLVDTLQIPIKQSKDQEEEEEEETCDTKASQLKEDGNYFYGKGDYNKAEVMYNEGLKIPGMSMYIKSILSLNLSTCLLAHYNFLAKNGNSSHQILSNALGHSKNACSCRPMWVKAYVKAAQILKIQGELLESFQMFQSALLINLITKEERISVEKECWDIANELKLRVDSLRHYDRNPTQTNTKTTSPSTTTSTTTPETEATTATTTTTTTTLTNSYSQTTTTTTKTPTRDILKEVEKYIEQNPLESKFPKGLIKSDQDLLKSFDRQSLQEQSKITGLSFEHISKLSFCNMGYSLMLQSKFRESLPYFYASKSFSGSLFQMGHIFQSSLGNAVPKDEKLALSLFYQSALQNDKFQVPNIENIKDPIKVIYFQKNMMVPESAYHVGIMFQRGLYGVQIDFDKTLFFYKKAADLNHLNACNNYGSLLYQGILGPEKSNKDLGLEYIKKGADLGDENCIEKYSQLTTSKEHANSISFNDHLLKFSRWLFNEFQSIEQLNLNKKYAIILEEIVKFKEQSSSSSSSSSSFSFSSFSSSTSSSSQNELKTKQFERILKTLDYTNIFIDGFKSVTSNSSNQSKTINEKLKLISNLSMAYQMELNFVCLPGLLHGQTIELINQLLKVHPKNKHLIVCFIGLHLLKPTKYKKCLELIGSLKNECKIINKLENDISHLDLNSTSTSTSASTLTSTYDLNFLKSIIHLLMGDFKLGLKTLDLCIEDSDAGAGVGVINEYFYFYKAFALDCLNYLETSIETKYSSESFYLKYLNNAPLDGFRVPDALLRLSIINSEKNKKINSLEFLQKFREYKKLPINDFVNFDRYILSSAEFDKQMVFQQNLLSKFTP